VPILGQNHWENLLQRFLREVSVKHLSGEIYAEVKVSVGFMETFFWEITLRNGGFAGKIWENQLEDDCPLPRLITGGSFSG
jgi:hypothetical protein